MKKLILLFQTLLFMFNLNAQSISGSFEFEGLDRDYLVDLPQEYQENMPLVLCIHGYSESMSWIRDYTLLHEFADTAGFVVAYPNATTNWNIGLNLSLLGTNDVGFISALIDTLHEQYEVDLSRVYCCGFSQGGMMTYKLAGELGHRFAAFASVAGTLIPSVSKTCKPVRPFPILHMHGVLDNLVTWEPNPINLGVDSTINFWLHNNGCSVPGDTVVLPGNDTIDGYPIEKISYTSCTGESKVLLYILTEGGHGWPLNNINANVEILNFFKEYQNPIADMAYANSLEASPLYVQNPGDTLTITAHISNPENHPVELVATIQENDSTTIDTIPLFDDGEHGDKDADDNIWGAKWALPDGAENMFQVKLFAHDLTYDKIIEYHWPGRITSLGPVQLADTPYTDIEYNDQIKTQYISLNLSNESSYDLENIQPILNTTDPRIKSTGTPPAFNMAAGTNYSCQTYFGYTEEYNPDSTINNPIHFDVTVYSNSFPYWSASFDYQKEVNTRTEIRSADKFMLYQNYPNPFKTTTCIQYVLQKPGNVQIEVYNSQGQKIETLHNESMSAGEHRLEFNGTGLPGGVYFYSFKTAEYFGLRKMIIVR